MEWTPSAAGIRAGLAASLLVAACVPAPFSATSEGLSLVDDPPDLLITLEPGRRADGDLVPVAPGIAGYRLRKGETRAEARAYLGRRPGVAAVEDNVRIGIPETQAPVAIAEPQAGRRVQSGFGSVGGGGATPSPSPPFSGVVGGGRTPPPTPTPPPAWVVGGGSATPATPIPPPKWVVGGGGTPPPSPNPPPAWVVGGGGIPPPSPSPPPAWVVGGGGTPPPSPSPPPAWVVGGGGTPPPSQTPPPAWVVGGGNGPTPTPKPTMAAFVGGSGDGSATPAPVGSPADVPQYLGFLPPTINDTYYSRQWHLPKIGVPEAWHVAAGLGFTPPLVAVLDTGIDVGHPDFAGRATLGPTFVSGTTTSADDHGHGTHVAGIIGARSGNGIGVASVAPEVKILGIKVLNSSGSGTLGSVIAGLFAARAAGARLVNISFGTPTRSSVMETAISQLVADGMILVAAAGNENTDVPLYPAGLNGVIAVGAVDSADKRASFSSGGAQVKIAAPGVDMISLSRNGGYTIGSGTSQAAPVVTGAIATMLTFRPRLTATNSADILFQTGKPASGFATETRRLDLTGAMTAIR